MKNMSLGAAALWLAACVLTVPACARAPSSPASHPTIQPTRAATPSTQPLPDGDYYIVVKHSYKAMSVVIEQGTPTVKQMPLSQARAEQQIWTLQHRDDGYTLRARFGGQYLVIPDGSQDAGEVAQLANQAAEEGGTWLLQPSLDSYNLVARHSGQALGADGASREDGVDFLQWQAPNRDANEQFYFIAAGRVPASHDRLANPLAQSHYDNQARHYVLAALVPGIVEGERMRRNTLMDYHPSGLYVQAGETIQLQVNGMAANSNRLVVMIGQADHFWNHQPATVPFEWVAQPGQNTLTAPRAGVMYFRYLDSGAGAAPPPNLQVEVTAGGTAMPFYVQGQTTRAQWQQMLRNSRAPYVEMVAPRTLITVTRQMYDRSNQDDPAVALAYLTQMIGFHDEISGLDGRQPLDQPSVLRLHYMQDTTMSQADLEKVFMYAGNGFVGMPGDSALILLNNPAAADSWGLWHEAGHTYQQADWTWSQVVEVTVNLYSLHAQQRFGLPSRLSEVDPDTGKSGDDWAREYLARQYKQFNDEASFPADASNWVRLAMFEDLRTRLGDDFYKNLHRSYRRQPLPGFVDDIPDDTKVQEFIYRASAVSGRDLTPFFRYWGLPADQKTAQRVAALQLPAFQPE